MDQITISLFDKSAAREPALLREFEDLWAKAESIWERYQATEPFAAYVGADFEAVYRCLIPMQGLGMTFLEWGSGLGVVSIMASRLGFKAYGIESVPRLVEHSEQLARDYGADVRFAQGSFIPDEFEWDPAVGDESVETFIDTPSGYPELDMELQDFDVIYAYPWPDEHQLFHNIIRSLGRRNAMLISYDAREGTDIVHFRNDE